MLDRAAIGPAARAALLVAVLAAAAIVFRYTPAGAWFMAAARGLAELGDRGALAMLAFVGVYVVATALGLPGSLLTLLGGAAFGLWPGFALNLGAAVAGATLAFLEGRYLGRDFMERMFGPTLLRLRGLEDPRRAFVTFLRLRLFPLAPFNAVNFGAGFTRAPLGPFVAGTALGIVPSTFIFTYFARVLVDTDLATRAGARRQVAAALIALLVLSAAPTAIALVRRRLRR